MDAIWQLETGINIFFQNLGTWLALPLKAVSFLGQAEFFLLLMPAIYWCFDSRTGLRLGLMLMATSGLNGWLKLVFHHPRPYWLDSRVAALATEPSFGMPSGHSQTAVAMWGYLARIYGRNKMVLMIAVAIIIFTGISRIYLGVHFADQVLAGWLVGVFLVLVFSYFEASVLRWVNRLSLTWLILILWVISMGMVGINYILIAWAGPAPAAWQATALAAAPEGAFNPLDPNGMVSLAGIALGMAGGAAWDWRRHGQPPTWGPWRQKIIRYLLGLGGLVILYFGLKLVLPDGVDFISNVVRYVRYTLVGLWVTCFAPSLFRRLGLV